jgi:hypothetical protein
VTPTCWWVSAIKMDLRLGVKVKTGFNCFMVMFVSSYKHNNRTN